MKYKLPSVRAMLVALAIASVTAPLAAQQLSPESQFLSAVRDGEGSKAAKLITEGGSTLINTQDDEGRGALHITVEKRNGTWTRYLLQNGARADIADKKKVTPLMLATQMGFVEGMEALIANKAKVDAQNRSGETALILAVHKGDRALVRMLMKAGASPDKRDYTGQSAREYAERDPRARAILDVIVNGVGAEEPAEQKQGELNFSGIEAKPATPSPQ